MNDTVNSINTIYDEDYLDNKEASSWRKWMKSNLKQPNDQDLYLLMKEMIRKMKKSDSQVFKETFKNKKFTNQLFALNDLAALAYLYTKIKNYIQDTFLAIFINKIEDSFESQEIFESSLYYKESHFKSMNKMSNQSMEFLKEKISIILEALDDTNYDDLPKPKKFIGSKVWAFWLMIYQSPVNLKNEIERGKFLIDLIFYNLTKSKTLNKTALFQILNDYILPLMASNKKTLSKNRFHILEFIPKKIFKEYLKSDDNYIPESIDEAMYLVSNILNCSYSTNNLKYILNLLSTYINCKEWTIIKNLCENYLIEKLISSFYSENYFKITYKIVSLIISEPKINMDGKIRIELDNKLNHILIYMDKCFTNREYIKNIKDLIEKQKKSLILNKPNPESKKNQISFQFNNNTPPKTNFNEQYTNKALRISLICHTENLPVPYRGLSNLGQTCYMNSFLQSLFMTNELKKILFNLDKDKQPHIVKELILLFQKLKTKPNTSDYFENAVSPLDFKNKLVEPYRTSNSQEDVFLFGNTLFDQITEKYKEDKYKNEVVAIMVKYFSCEFENRIRCLICNTISTKNLQMQWMIRIDLNLSKERDFTTLIRNSLVPTVLEYEVYCSKCDKKSEKTEKYNIIRRIPPYLLISINLTSFDSRFDEPQKIIAKVKPLMELDIVKVFKELAPIGEKNINIEGEYKLYAIIIHAGVSADFGHYYALARNLDPNENKGDTSWYVFNDREVRKIGLELNLDKVLEKSETPTIFFFENKKKLAIESNLEATIRNISTFL